MASTQVPFSKKSPVFCTPINCDELEKLDDKAPTFRVLYQHHKY